MEKRLCIEGEYRPSLIKAENGLQLATKCSNNLWPVVKKRVSSSDDITGLLQRWGTDGDTEALEKLAPLVYRELHRLAFREMRRERADHTLQTTALVNEAYLRLVNWKNVQWQNRAQFFAVAAQIMRRVLVDYARSRIGLKRGGGAWPVSLDEASIVAEDHLDMLLAVNEALERLASVDPRVVQVVELRYFAGLTIEEAAEVLKVSHTVVTRDWAIAKAWLWRELRGKDVR